MSKRNVSGHIMAPISDDEASPTSLKTITEASGMHPTRVSAMLSYLIRRGHVRRVARGLYVRVRE